MNISLKRARAIFVKDYKEFSRNYAVSICLVFPIVFAFIFRDSGTPVAFGFLLNFSFVIVTCLVQACLIAEEKERNTLRSLMMTPASTGDVLIGKSSLAFVMSAVVLAITTYLVDYQPASLWAFVVAVTLSIILYTAAGTICGLYSKSVLEASLSVLPVAAIFTGATGGALLVDRYPIFKVLDYMPSSQLVHLLDLSSGYTTGDVLKPLLIILAWTLVLCIVAIILYQRRLKDE
ncbi:ABC transporter permease [Paenibacillus sp. CAU 1782]